MKNQLTAIIGAGAVGAVAAFLAAPYVGRDWAAPIALIAMFAHFAFATGTVWWALTAIPVFAVNAIALRFVLSNPNNPGTVAGFAIIVLGNAMAFYYLRKFRRA